jgi:hypothetical protein
LVENCGRCATGRGREDGESLAVVVSELEELVVERELPYVGNPVLVLLCGYLGLALVTPPVLNAERDARGIAAGAAAAVALGLLGASRVALDGVGVVPYLLLAPPAILCRAAALGAHRSLRGGIETAAWATLLGTLTTFAVGLFEALHWHQAGAGLLLDADAPSPASTNFGDLVFCLVALPLWWAPLRSSVPSRGPGGA